MSESYTQSHDIENESVNYNQNDNNSPVEEKYLKNHIFECLNSDGDNNETLENDFINISNNISQNQIIDIKTLLDKNISDIYQNCDKLKDSNIGPLVPFKFFIKEKLCGENDYEKFLDLNIDNLVLIKFRKIKGDGNCFYRSFFFSFIENIILTKNILFMKEIFIIFNNIILDNDYEEINNTVLEELKAILFIIIDFMQDDNNNSEAFIFFQKAFLFNQSFDAGIVFFMKYLIKEYLSLNENKYYSVDNDIPLCSILPDEYKKEERYLFDEYYKKDLMKMNEDDKDIAIYVSPYVFNCELNIFEIKYDNQNNRIECYNNCIIPGGNSFFTINLIYDSKIKHYDLVYTENFYEKYKNYLKDLTESKYADILNEQILEKQIKVLYLKYLEANTSSSNLIDDLRSYINSKSYISKILLNDDKKKEIIEEIINQKNKCIKCLNQDFKESYFKFYCGCKICKEECFNKYIEPAEDDENKIYYDYFTKCPCGEEFNKKKVEEYLTNHENKNKVKYDKLIQAHWKWRCMICNDTFNRRFRYYRLIFKEKCEYTKKNLEHLICFKCNNDNKGKKEIECKFCGILHTFKSLRYVNEENKNEAICIII